MKKFTFTGTVPSAFRHSNGFFNYVNYLGHIFTTKGTDTWTEGSGLGTPVYSARIYSDGSLVQTIDSNQPTEADLGILKAVNSKVYFAVAIYDGTNTYLKCYYTADGSTWSNSSLNYMAGNSVIHTRDIFLIGSTVYVAFQDENDQLLIKQAENLATTSGTLDTYDFAWNAGYTLNNKFYFLGTKVGVDIFTEDEQGTWLNYWNGSAFISEKRLYKGAIGTNGVTEFEDAHMFYQNGAIIFIDNTNGKIYRSKLYSNEILQLVVEGEAFARFELAGVHYYIGALNGDLFECYYVSYGGGFYKMQIDTGFSAYAPSDVSRSPTFDFPYLQGNDENFPAIRIVASYTTTTDYDGIIERLQLSSPSLEVIDYQNVLDETDESYILLSDDSNNAYFFGSINDWVKQSGSFREIVYNSPVKDDLNIEIESIQFDNLTEQGILTYLSIHYCKFLYPGSVNNVTTYSGKFGNTTIMEILKWLQFKTQKLISIAIMGAITLEIGTTDSTIKYDSSNIISDMIIKQKNEQYGKVILIGAGIRSEYIVSSSKENIYWDYYPRINNQTELDDLAEKIGELKIKQITRLEFLTNNTTMPIIGQTAKVTWTTDSIDDDYIILGYKFNTDNNQYLVVLVSAIIFENRLVEQNQIEAVKQQFSAIVNGDQPLQGIKVLDSGNYKGTQCFQNGLTDYTNTMASLTDGVVSDIDTKTLIATPDTAFQYAYVVSAGSVYASFRVQLAQTDKRFRVGLYNDSGFCANVYFNLDGNIYEEIGSSVICPYSENVTYHIVMEFIQATTIKFWVNGLLLKTISASVPNYASELFIVSGVTGSGTIKWGAVYCGTDKTAAFLSLTDSQIYSKYDTLQDEHIEDARYHPLDYLDKGAGWDSSTTSDQTVDLSSLVPAGTRAVNIRLQVAVDTANAGNYVVVKRYGNSNNYQALVVWGASVAGYFTENNGIVQCSTDLKLTVDVTAAAGTVTYALEVLGYYL